MHAPRSPAVSPGTQALAWAAGLGLYVFLFMLAISISMATAIVTSLVSAILIFVAVRRYGSGALRRR